MIKYYLLNTKEKYPLNQMMWNFTKFNF